MVNLKFLNSRKRKEVFILASFLFLFLFVISLNFVSAAAPTINFISPTPNNNAILNVNYTIINVSISENVSSCILSWDPWADYNCNYRVRLNFSNPTNENLTNFPVMIKLNSSRINYSKTNPTDIRFYDSDDATLLKKETELWNSSGDSYIWVKVPQTDIGTSDYIYAYYNCTNTNSDDAANVWDSNYKMVHHLEESSGTIYDSTTNANHATANSGNPTSQGKFDGAYSYGSYKYTRTGMSGFPAGSNPRTIEAWIYPFASNARIPVFYGSTSADNGFYFIMQGTNIGIGKWGGGDNMGTTNLTIGNWYHVALTYNGSTAILYLNGSVEVSALRSYSTTLSSSYIAYPSSDSFNGIVDEVRVSNITRNESWIKATYLSGTDSFVIYGSEETSGKATINYTMNINNADKNTTAYYTVTNLLNNINYTYEVWCNDTAGNSNSTETRNITIDTILPQIQFVSPTEISETTINRSYILVNVTASDASLKNITVRLYNSTSLVDSSTSTSSPFFVNFTNLAKGIYYFNATACDIAGNCNNTETRNVLISPLNIITICPEEIFGFYNPHLPSIKIPSFGCMFL